MCWARRRPARPPRRRSRPGRRSIAAIEQESTTKTGLRSDVVPLYQGSEYWLYRYKKYTDVRLVFAPEQPIAFFGGDPDNFTYPRYDFDMALFRVYENNVPVASRDYLKWSASGAADGELVFVSGHPGSTDRLATVAQLETQRDVIYPISIAVVSRPHRRAAQVQRAGRRAGAAGGGDPVQPGERAEGVQRRVRRGCTTRR